ncbi:MAG: tetratricopeptide repeat protein, partial [Deltaproteobacteria bacterium]|nr:tetratricopeptide repeat protein [Deltaproteobacteria bacterium]
DVAGERNVEAPTCEAIVGPSFALLGSDQPERARSEVKGARRSLMLGRVDDALAQFCRAAVLDPTRPETFGALVRLYLLKGDAAKARDWAERAAKQHPADVEVQGLYGDALARAGDADRARALWLELARVPPGDESQSRLLALGYVRLADRAVKAADAAQADRYYRRAVLLDPLSGTAAAGLSRVLLVQGPLASALHFARRAVGLVPRDAELRVLLGAVLEKHGDLDAAREEWKAGYAIDPGNYRAAARALRAGSPR